MVRESLERRISPVTLLGRCPDSSRNSADKAHSGKSVCTLLNPAGDRGSGIVIDSIPCSTFLFVVCYTPKDFSNYVKASRQYMGEAFCRGVPGGPESPSSTAAASQSVGKEKTSVKQG